MPQDLGSQLPPALLEIVRLSLRITILVVIFVPLERLFAAHPRKIFRRGIVVDLAYYVINSLVIGLLMSIPAGFLAWTSTRVLPTAFLHAMGGLPLWAARSSGWSPGRSAITGATASAMRSRSSGISTRSTTAPRRWTSW